MRRRTFVELTGISVSRRPPPRPRRHAPAARHRATRAHPHRADDRHHTRADPRPPIIAALTLSVTRARSALPGVPLLRADHQPAPPARPSRCRLRHPRRRRQAPRHALSADAYHVTAGILLKAGDQGLAHLAADRSMSAALASQDPLTVGASARIVTHTLMNSGQLMAAIATARNHRFA